MIEEDVMLHITEGRLARSAGMAVFVIATTPRTFVSKMDRQSSSSECSTGR